MVLLGHEVTGHLQNAKAKKPERRCLKDSTHAARRVLERPWRADPDLNKVLSTIATGPDSLPRMISNSYMLRGIFAECIRQTGGGAIEDSLQEVQNISSAQHRFDSRLLPLTRFVHLFDAFVAAALIIAHVRRGSEDARHFSNFFNFIEGKVGARRLLVLAMCADCGYICNGLLRFFDNSDCDPALIAEKSTASHKD